MIVVYGNMPKFSPHFAIFCWQWLHMAARYREGRERERHRSPLSRRRRDYAADDEYYSYNDLDYEREARNSLYDRSRTEDYGYYHYRESLGHQVSGPYTRRSLHSPPRSSHHFFPRRRYNDEYHSIPHRDYRLPSFPRRDLPLPDYLAIPRDYVTHSQEYLTRPPPRNFGTSPHDDFRSSPPRDRDFVTPPPPPLSLYARDYSTIPSSIALQLSPEPSPLRSPSPPLPPPSPAPLFSAPPSPPLPLFTPPPPSPPSPGLQWRGSSNDLLYTDGPGANDTQDSSMYYNEGEKLYSMPALDTSDLSNALQTLRRSIKSEDMRSNDLRSADDDVKDSVFMRLDNHTRASSIKSEDTSTGNYYMFFY